MAKIKIGIVGYGNLGKGMEAACLQADDMELVGIFSRRDPASLGTESPAFHLDELSDFQGEIDVLLLAGGSQSDIPQQGPALAEHFSTVDAYDKHADIDRYFQEMDKIGQAHKTTSIISTGWDPGLFSLMRAIGQAILPQGQTYTFWGPGLSQGHSDAVRRIEGVAKAAQYTLPSDQMLEDIRQGKFIQYSSTSAHEREVFVVLEEGADAEAIEESIVTMPDYFEGYKTQVHFISEEEFQAEHLGMPHGGRVLRRGETGPEEESLMEFSLELASNPGFTASVSLAFARACYRLSERGQYGAHTVLDLPLGLLLNEEGTSLRSNYL